MTKFDLHLHTTASDGELTTWQIVSLAKKQGFKLIAITDHDTVSGAEEGFEASQRLGVRVIPGVEISTEWQEKKVHILGYGIDIKNKILLNKLEEFKKERKRRAKKITAKLRKLGFKIYFSDIIEKAHGSIGRPHIAKAVLAYPENRVFLKKEIDWRKFIEQYLAEGKSAFIKKEKIDSVEAIKLIHIAGGLAVWAHSAYYTPDKEELVRVAEKFKKAGLDGIEVFCRDHDKRDVELLYGLAKKLKFFITGGSDFHSPKTDKLGGFATFSYPFPVPKFEA